MIYKMLQTFRLLENYFVMLLDAITIYNRRSICFKDNRRNASINCGLDLTGLGGVLTNCARLTKVRRELWWRPNPKGDTILGAKFNLPLPSPLETSRYTRGRITLKQTNCEMNSCLVRPREFPWTTSREFYFYSLLPSFTIPFRVANF